MMTAEKEFCGRCKHSNECKRSDKYSYVSHIQNLICFTPCETARHDEVAGIDLYVYSNGNAIINDWYYARLIGLKQEYLPHEELKELVETRVEANKKWAFRS